MATTVGLIKGATEAILGIGEVCVSQFSVRTMKVMLIVVVGLSGQLHIQAVLQVVSFTLHSRQRRGSLQPVLRGADIVRDSKWW